MSMFLLRLTLAAVVTGAGTLAAQDAPLFRGTTDLVVLHVSVTDARGNHVPDLDRAAFAVFEDARPQTVSVFKQEDEPVTAGLLVDSSISMHSMRDLVIAGSVSFARHSHPQD